MTETQTTKLEEMKDNYANLIIDGMDMDCLIQFAYDSIMQSMEMWDEEDLKEEVIELYDEEVWNDLNS